MRNIRRRYEPKHSLKQRYQDATHIDKREKNIVNKPLEFGGCLLCSIITEITNTPTASNAVMLSGDTFSILLLVYAYIQKYFSYILLKGCQLKVHKCRSRNYTF